MLCLAEQQAVVRTCCNRNHPDALKRVDDAGCQLEALCHLLLRLVPVTRRDEERVWVVPNLPAISDTGILASSHFASLRRSSSFR